MGIKIKKRMVVHSAAVQQKHGFRSHVVYDATSDLFWTGANTPQQAVLNLRWYQNQPNYRRSAKKSLEWRKVR
jgi:hypothetical protein